MMGEGQKFRGWNRNVKSPALNPPKSDFFFSPQLFSFDQVWFHTTYHTDDMFYRHLDLHNCVTGTDLVINFSEILISTGLMNQPITVGTG